MRKIEIRYSAIIVGLAIVFIGGAALGVFAPVWAGHPVAHQGNLVPMYVGRQMPAPKDAAAAQGFASVFKPALPAVVSILSSRMVKVPQNPFFNNPFFQQFFGGQMPQGPQQQRERGLGSGVIVSPDGYILTNNHVIDKATEIKVMLSDKREFTGKLVGADPQTDIAVVKIPATGLPTIPFGDSSKLQVGDYAFAIGNPFGVGETATMGIISATGRNGLSIEDYEDFIQTDAAINPGNSGGPLLNIHSEIIGVNTAILAGNSGGNQGIGFAIPINMARYVMDQILKHGKVVRGYIGVGIQEVTPSLAKVFHVPPEKGALVGNVEPGTPGAKAGLQRGDVITAIDGQPVTGPNELRLKIGQMTPGATVHLTVNRNGQTHEVNVTLGEAPTGKTGPGGQGGEAENTPMRGVGVQPLTAELRQQLGLNPDIQGVVVNNVNSDSPASDAGLQRGDVIEQINRQPVNSVAEYHHLIQQAGNQAVVLLVNRGGNTTFVVVQPE